MAGVEPAALETMASLRATRWFAPRPVDEGDLERVLEAARWTGSARNRQPWRFVVAREPALLEALAGLGAYARHLAGAPLAILLAIDRQAGGADAEFDAGRVAQSIMLAAHALGLGSCPATLFPEANAARATALAGLAPPWRVRTAIALGHPAPRPPGGRLAVPRGRLPLAALRRTPPS